MPETINAMAASIYEPLHEDGDTFRLMRVHPSPRFEDEIKVDLIIAQLSESPSYEALSYVWGPPPNEGAVTTKGIELAIRGNLDEFVRVIRDQSQSRIVYADAICINQADIHERASQIQIMGGIYRNAKAVLSYLGPGDDNTDAVMRGSTKVNIDDYIITQEISEGERGFWKEGIFEEAELQVLKSTMFQLVHREYWKRAWIIQECLLGKDVQIFCGHASASWEEFLTMYMMLIDKEPRAKVYNWGYVDDEWTTITRFDHIAGQRSRMDKFPCHLADIVTYFVAAESTDPRDMLYAFLGLMKESDPGHPRRMVADYTVTATELFFLAGHAYVYSPDSGRPHRVLYGLKQMLGVTTGELLQAVCELIDPNELVCPVDWIVGSLEHVETGGRKFRGERKLQLAYMECFERDFSTLTRLQYQKRRREVEKQASA